MWSRSDGSLAGRVDSSRWIVAWGDESVVSAKKVEWLGLEGIIVISIYK